MEWVLRQFGAEEKKAREACRRFVKEGLGQESIWKEVKGQVLLGDEVFREGFKEKLNKYANIPDIPKSQRYLHSSSLQKIFAETTDRSRKKRDVKIAEAVDHYGYTRREGADFPKIHFSSVSRIL